MNEENNTQGENNTLERVPVVEVLHGFRKEIDACIKKAGLLKLSEGMEPSGREISIAYTKLQEANMWVNKALHLIVVQGEGASNCPEKV